jgi:hypothetical protein
VLAVEKVLPRDDGLGRSGFCELTFLNEAGDAGPGYLGEVAAMMRVFAEGDDAAGELLVCCC